MQQFANPTRFLALANKALPIIWAVTIILFVIGLYVGIHEALKTLKRFGSLTVLNGHIHQVLQKVEGNVTFHSARSTAFPQSEPGKGTPGPIRDLPAEKLKAALGLSAVSYVENRGSLAIVDSTIE